MAQWRDKIVDAFNRLTLLLFASECPQPAKPRDPTFQKLKLKHVEAALWGGFAEHAAHELHWRVHSRKNRSQAAWVLARWSAAEARYRDCLNYLKFHRPTNSNANTRAWLLHADALSRCDIHEQAEMVGAQLLSHRQGGQDANLLYAAIAPEAERLGRINQHCCARL